jgi:hypothetical protein
MTPMICSSLRIAAARHVAQADWRTADVAPVVRELQATERTALFQ